MSITHSFVSSVADSSSTTLVKPSNWNANHTYLTVPVPMFSITGGTGNLTWNTQPTATSATTATDLFGNAGLRWQHDLRYAKTYQLTAYVVTPIAAAQASQLRVQFSSDETAGGWKNLSTGTNGGISLLSSGIVASSVVAVSTAAIDISTAFAGPCYMRIAGTAASSAGSPVFGNIRVLLDPSSTST